MSYKIVLIKNKERKVTFIKVYDKYLYLNHIIVVGSISYLKDTLGL